MNHDACVTAGGRRADRRGREDRPFRQQHGPLASVLRAMENILARSRGGEERHAVLFRPRLFDHHHRVGPRRNVGPRETATHVPGRTRGRRARPGRHLAHEP